MRAGRLLSILLLLNVRGQVSAQELADELEVSVRTVYRDVEALGSAGIPIYASRGRTGGFQLLDGYRTKLTGLTPDEADALFLSGLPGAAADLGLGSVLAATQLKLLAALPPELRERAARIRDRFHLDAPGWLRESEAPKYLPAIAEAVWAQRRVQVRYERANREVVGRRLEPLGLVLKAGTWYLVASVPDDHDRHGPRTYRLSRVLSAAVLDEPFERPDGFDLQEQWAAYQRGYERRVYRESATIRLSEAGRQLLFLVGSIAARAAHRSMSEPDSEGWAQTTLPIESVRHAHHALLQLGADVEVLEPTELRDLIAQSARALVLRYASCGSAR
ncbi:MAG: YafY family transcriptional regulator [Actinomycetota bacterium]|nr:YafY family transcriptional regulator [Actinomycetota bacterium]